MSTRQTFLALSSTLVFFAACATGALEPNKDSDDDNGSSSTGSGSGQASSGAQGPTGSGTTSAAGPTGSGTTSGTSGSGAGGASTTTTGAGGDTTSGSGVGGATTSTTMAATTTTVTSGGNTCAHDVCVEGVALTPGCGDNCVDLVCAADDYCCLTAWDSLCVEEVLDYCGIDCFGGGMLQPGDIVITEIMNNPNQVTDANGEWFEIYNASSNPIDLGSLVIRHQDPAVDATAVESVVSTQQLAPGDYAVFGINANTATNGNISVDYEYANVNLSNTADYLAIEDSGGVTIDLTTWDENGVGNLDPNGASRTLDGAILSASQNDDDTNFCAATSPIAGSGDFGTPGAANDLCP